MNYLGTVYLLHFDPPYKHAGHYLGWTSASAVEIRVERHLNGRGSPLVAAAVTAGCRVTVARTWPLRDRNFERSLKKHSTTRLCPICTERPRQVKGGHEK